MSRGYLEALEEQQGLVERLERENADLRAKLNYVFPEMEEKKAHDLAMETDYAVFACGEPINVADATEFFRLGYEYARHALAEIKEES